MGLANAQGLILASAFYWDMTDETRAWAARFIARVNKVTTMAQAGTYGAVLHYLKAIQAAGTDDGPAVVAKMKELPINDFFTKNGVVRADGRVIRDMYLFQVKTPEESKGRFDYYKLLDTALTGNAGAFKPGGTGPAAHPEAASRQARSDPPGSPRSPGESPARSARRGNTWTAGQPARPRPGPRRHRPGR